MNTFCGDIADRYLYKIECKCFLSRCSVWCIVVHSLCSVHLVLYFFYFLSLFLFCIPAILLLYFSFAISFGFWAIQTVGQSTISLRVIDGCQLNKIYIPMFCLFSESTFCWVPLFLSFCIILDANFIFILILMVFFFCRFLCLVQYATNT